MTAPPARSRLLAVALAWIMGATDAIGFIETGGFFVSFMAGDATRLGVSLGAADRGVARIAGALVVLFVVGVAAATLAARRAGARRGALLLFLQAALLALGAGLLGRGRAGAGVAATVLAMAFASTVIAEEDGAALGAPSVTGVLARVGRGLAEAIAGGARLAWAPPLLLAVALLAGGATGAVVEARWGPAALWLPAAASLIVALSLAAPSRYDAAARGPGGRRSRS